MAMHLMNLRYSINTQEKFIINNVVIMTKQSLS